jgi:hypothetical protein
MEVRKMLEFVFSLLMGLEQLTQGCGTFIECFGDFRPELPAVDIDLG